jgi:hypothetical protein
VQFVGIPEFQSFGTVVGQNVAGALAGKMTVEAALKASQEGGDPGGAAEELRPRSFGTKRERERERERERGKGERNPTASRRDGGGGAGGGGQAEHGIAVAAGAFGSGVVFACPWG